MRKLLLCLCAASLGFGWACNSGSSSDGGTDATSEQLAPICDINSFTGSGTSCAHASNVVCFSDPTCEAGNGCTCKDTDAGPKWSCFTPPECQFPCSSSPLVDAQPCDSGSDVEVTPDASDAGADAASE